MKRTHRTTPLAAQIAALASVVARIERIAAHSGQRQAELAFELQALRDALGTLRDVDATDDQWRRAAGIETRMGCPTGVEGIWARVQAARSALAPRGRVTDREGTG